MQNIFLHKVPKGVRAFASGRMIVQCFNFTYVDDCRGFESNLKLSKVMGLWSETEEVNPSSAPSLCPPDMG